MNDDELLASARDAHRWRRTTLGAVALWAIIATVGVFSLALQSVRNTTALNKATKAYNAVLTQEARQHQQILNACVRLNVLRASDNASHLGDYQVDSFVAKSIAVSPKTETAAQKRSTAQFAKALAGAVDRKTWTPLTDCSLAVALSGSAYTTPTPIPFIKMLPPASATNAANASLLTPVGSTP